MTKILTLPAAGVLLLGLAACNPYDPGERALGGGIIGAGSGAAIGGGAGRRHRCGDRRRDRRGRRRDHRRRDDTAPAGPGCAAAALGRFAPRSGAGAFRAAG